MGALISTGGLLLIQILLNKWKRRERADEIDTAAEEKLSALGQKLIDRYDASAAALALQLAECRTQQADLYNKNLELRGDKATLERQARELEADLKDVRRDLSDAGARYLFLESAVNAAGLTLSPRGKIVKKMDSGEVEKQ